MSIQSLNPATGQIEKTFESLTSEQIEQKLVKADEAFSSWKKTSFVERARLLMSAAKEMRENARKYGEIMTREMGKPILQAISEVEKCAWNFEHYAEHGEKYLQSENIETEASESYVQYEPLGVILLVMPWNFPLWQVFRMAVPVIMAGNTVLLKHASNVPQCALVCEDIFRQAGFPEGIFQTLLIGSGDVEDILRDPRVKGVSLTGSEKAGSTVAGIAGAEVKPVVMELGGSDPFIVLEDADVEFACEQAKISRLLNAGQVCLSAKRFLVHLSRYEEFCDRLKHMFEGYIVGDPMDEKTQMGPMSSEQGFLDIIKQVDASIKMGATVLTGGNRLKKDGFFFTPTILSDVTLHMPAWKEETFGPVATVMPFDSTDEAVALANDSLFGLNASLYTQDINLAKEIIPRLEAGSVFVNGVVKTDPRLPTGGIKRSGVGRELGAYGIRAFCNVKTVWIK
ncbi:MAG: NADP-dependent succinic semialdehyde dehydrogenase [Candidatus Magasanikbacteria bacterium CG_4_10_14_0_2_um_filter_37_12]|uniref:NADP-dependent succinic semialdehyde dehydrogenase n=1 Tax=Candidatus Magasanikbacteria bacterium CG_4_10_14_0_2_um_filter_37_12 TaxID=1974637 RepID=A0A2M7V775_9BACT|nr:MAG: NADP-dependent succinic semialdehyde dehydrogenase [Candidatus Magasanikbacteria bacterium CG_4_10_14_0_2_um_filter_37_12]